MTTLAWTVQKINALVFGLFVIAQPACIESRSDTGKPASPSTPAPAITSPAPRLPTGSKRAEGDNAREATFTIREYRIYRALVDNADAADDQDRAVREVAREYGIPADDVRSIAESVMHTLSGNGWFGKPEDEIKHGSDWKGGRE